MTKCRKCVLAIGFGEAATVSRCCSVVPAAGSEHFFLLKVWMPLETRTRCVPCLF
jgi:hypothetical protein